MRRVTLSHGELEGLLMDVLDRAGTVTFRAAGGSMWPFIRSGDEVHVHPLPAAGLAVGDVVVFRADKGRIRLHRIVGQRAGFSTRWYLRGDSQTEAEAVPAENLIGRVVSLRRGNRQIPMAEGLWWWLGRSWAAGYPLTYWAGQALCRIMGVRHRLFP